MTCLPRQYVGSTLRIAQQLDLLRRRDAAIHRVARLRVECARLVHAARARRTAVVSREFDRAVEHWCQTHSGGEAFGAGPLDWTSRRLLRLFLYVHPRASVAAATHAVVKAVNKWRQKGVVVEPHVTLFDTADADW